MLTNKQIIAIQRDLDAAPRTLGRYGRPIRVKNTLPMIAAKHGVTVKQVKAVDRGAMYVH